MRQKPPKNVSSSSSISENQHLCGRVHSLESKLTKIKRGMAHAPVVSPDTIEYIGSNIYSALASAGLEATKIDVFIGRRVRKCFFKEQKEHFGTIVNVFDDNETFRVRYDDTDEEDLNRTELGVWNASMKMYYALPDVLPDNDSTSSGENLSESGATVSIVHLILIFVLYTHHTQ